MQRSRYVRNGAVTNTPSGSNVNDNINSSSNNFASDTNNTPSKILNPVFHDDIFSMGSFKTQVTEEKKEVDILGSPIFTANGSSSSNSLEDLGVQLKQGKVDFGIPTSRVISLQQCQSCGKKNEMLIDNTCKACRTITEGLNNSRRLLPKCVFCGAQSADEGFVSDGKCIKCRGTWVGTSTLTDNNHVKPDSLNPAVEKPKNKTIDTKLEIERINNEIAKAQAVRNNLLVSSNNIPVVHSTVGNMGIPGRWVNKVGNTALIRVPDAEIFEQEMNNLRDTIDSFICLLRNLLDRDSNVIRTKSHRLGKLATELDELDKACSAFIVRGDMTAVKSATNT